MVASETLWLNNLSRDHKSGIRSLFERYYVPLVLFAGNYIHNQDAAKDLVQDVFYALIESNEKFTTIENLKVYLYSAVKNRCLKYLRHEEVKDRYINYMSQAEQQEAFYHDRILEEEVFSLLNQAIQQLPEQCKKVFLLALEGKNNSEIADLMGIGLETVKSHKKTGKKILYTKLKGVVPVVVLTFYMDLLMHF